MASLHEFLDQNRAAIVARTREKAALRAVPQATETELKQGVPLLVDELVGVLRAGGNSGSPHDGKIEGGAVKNVTEMLRMDFTVGQIVHAYGDVREAITELADEMGVPLTFAECQLLRECVDSGIAAAVTEFARQRERSMTEKETERLGVFAHELRNLVTAAMLAFDVLRTGRVESDGVTADALGRCLIGLRDLIHRSLAEVRLASDVRKLERIAVADLIEELEVGAMLEARARGLRLAVDPAPRNLIVRADRQLLISAVSNLLQNALKFTRVAGTVSLNTRATDDRVLIEIEDECGGLPPGQAEELFRPFEQRSEDRSGLGLGLTIARRSIEVTGGALSVRDLPGKGCVFTVDLPRHPGL